MRIYKATGQRLGSMTWARAVCVLRELGLEDRLNSPDKHEARRAMLEADKATLVEED